MKTKLTLFLMLAMLVGVTGWLTACQNSYHAHRSMHFSRQGNPSVMDFIGGEQLGLAGASDSVGRLNRVVGATEAPARFLAKPGDDIWVIVKPSPTAKPRPDHDDNRDDHPGAGAMIALLPPSRDDADAEPTLVPMPLKHTDVRASVTGYIATVDVEQQFHNPFGSKIEAVYQFPLPQDAAVSEFVMEVGPEGDRRQIRGIVREKAEAERIYRAARSQGYNASLLTQVRPNIFEQKVANIEPGKQIDINIRYFNTLGYSDGWYTFTFPMVVGPRYNPAGSEDPVHAIAHGDRAPANDRTNGTAIQYLRPDERTGHDINLTLDIDAGVSIEEAKSLTHAVDATNPDASPNKLRVELSPNDTLPNKDFVFAFRVAGQTMKSGLVTHEDADGQKYFTLMLYPPADLESLDRQPMEMVFVLDTSGSMSGEPMRQSKDAMEHALKQLRPADSFQIIRFSSDASALGNKPLRATRFNLNKGQRFVDRLSGNGGTRMIEGIKAALDFPHDPDRYRVVTFLTDGYIGNETQILREMNDRIDDARVFSFGVGSSTNRFLLDRMAKVGRGASAYLLPDVSGKDVMDLYFERISRPAMTDLEISWGAANVSEVYPKRIPDLIVGRPVVLTGKYTGQLNDIRVTGRAGPRDLALTVDADRPAEHPALAQVWARRKIADLMDRMALENNAKWQPDVLATALRYNLVSAYTSFLAVDTSRRTEGSEGTTVRQPLPMPKGVKYETTVGE
ncbi:MAG: VIT and vWA domain-containing protein [Phycisphaeraceae bacterium]